MSDDSFNGRCMASLKNDPEKTCSRKTKLNSDFCGYHSKHRSYNERALTDIRNNDMRRYKITKKMISDIMRDVRLNQIVGELKTDVKNSTNRLDSEYGYMLMDIKDGWTDVPVSHRILLSDGWWDITILINHITNQLNQSNMENPYPIYPSSPFTRLLYSVDDISKIRQRIVDIHMKVNVALKVFLTSNNDQLERFYDEAITDPNMFSSSLLQQLKSSLRYRMMNSLNSQGQFTGHWIRQSKPKDGFERLYDTYSKMSPEIYDHFTGYYVRNYNRDYYYDMLTSSKCLNWGTFNDFTQEYL
jgi:hypothetical protein